MSEVKRRVGAIARRTINHAMTTGLLNTSLPYASKAEMYARYRWDYAPRAIQTIRDAAHIGPQSCVADIGAGTGILTRHFVESAGQVYAVEPDAAMIAWACRALASYSSFHSVIAPAEATTLTGHSIDLITVGQALHWFAPDAARREFARILRPGGWLAIVWNHPADSALGEALGDILTVENGWDATPNMNRPVQEPFSFYFGSEAYTRLTFPATRLETWDEFIGSLGSDSHAPDEGSDTFTRLSRAARQVFDRFSQSEVITVHFATELCLGQMTEA